ncbi:multidrug efflux SMR transporter [Vibrio parahaemolyticus]|nr:multidrug efflux SMR transporter [Vibrio parahaemolyticus]
MAWVILILASISEVLWAISLKLSHGFTKPLASNIAVIFLAISITLLGLALRQLPLGIVYAVWVGIGIGILGTSIVGVIVFDETLNSLKFLSLIIIIIGIVGIKMSES